MKSKLHTKIVLIFSGFNQRAVLSFIRTLESINISYAIVAKSKDDSIFMTRYKEKVISIRSSIGLDLNDIKNQLAIAREKLNAPSFFIVPSAEAFNRFLLFHRSELEEQENCIIPLVHESLYKEVSDKILFSKLCQKNKIAIPRELVSSKLVWPFVAKPKYYFSESKKEIFTPVLVHNDSELKAFLSKYNKDDFFYQEFVTGKSLYLLYYFCKDGTIIKSSQQNLVQQSDGKSIIAAISSDFHTTHESLKYERMLTNCNFRGLIMIEVKQQNNINYMIEANPRLWGPSQLFIDADRNLFISFLKDYNLITGTQEILSNEILKDTRYFWFGGLAETLHQKKQPAFHMYDMEQLTTELPQWIASDVYRREDTTNLFYNELITG